MLARGLVVIFLLLLSVQTSASASAAETQLASTDDWGALENAATKYVMGHARTLDELQTAIVACATGPLPPQEAKDVRAAAAWAACQGAVKTLNAASGQAIPEAQKAFWAAFQDWLWAHAWFRLRESAKAYKLAKSPGAVADAAWTNKMQEHVASRAESSKLERDAAAQSVILDWMNDHKGQLGDKRPEAILEACRIFCWAHDEDIALPGAVLEGLQRDNNMTVFGRYLDEQSKPETAQAKRETN